MKRTLTALTVTVLLSAAVAVAQERPLGASRPEQLAEMEWIEFEVVSVEAEDWSVMAKDTETGEQFRFRMPPQVFQGQRFTADFDSAAPGTKVSAKGEPESKLQNLKVEAPLAGGGAKVGGFRKSPARDDDRGAPPRMRPGAPDGREDLRYGAPDAAIGNRPGAGGPAQYQIVSVDAERWMVTASSSQGGTVEFEVDPDSFVGYRFKAPVRGLRRGEGFALLALNQKPIEACCKLVGGGR